MEYLYIKETLDALLKADKKRRSLSDKLSKGFGEFTQKKLNNLNADLNYICIDIEKLEHEFHCRLVECGFAKLDPEKYGYAINQTSGFHKYKTARRTPNKSCFKKWAELLNNKD